MLSFLVRPSLRTGANKAIRIPADQIYLQHPVVIILLATFMPSAFEYSILGVGVETYRVKERRETVCRGPTGHGNA